jgi:hypothetical protein
VYSQAAYSRDLARVRAYITGLETLLGSYDKDPDIQVETDRHSYTHTHINTHINTHIYI